MKSFFVGQKIRQILSGRVGVITYRTWENGSYVRFDGEDHDRIVRHEHIEKYDITD